MNTALQRLVQYKALIGPMTIEVDIRQNQTIATLAFEYLQTAVNKISINRLHFRKDEGTARAIHPLGIEYIFKDDLQVMLHGLATISIIKSSTPDTAKTLTAPSIFSRSWASSS